MIARRRTTRVPAVAAVSGSFGRDLDACLAQIERSVKRARRRGAELVVFPESALGGYLYELKLPANKPPVPSPPALESRGAVMERLAEIAGSSVICVGYTEAEEDRLYSSAVCVGGDGVLGHHRKVHLPPGERAAFSAGEGFAAFDTPAGRMGMLICYDKVFPEAARQLSLDGAGIVASLSAWPVDRRDPAVWARRDREVRHFDLLDQARALENQVVWVSSNQCGRLGSLRFPGHAKVVDPDGRILCQTGGRPAIALARVDPASAVERARRQISHLGDRRPYAYGVDTLTPLPSAAA